ncbi:hypothetical protein ABW21_db0207109 [Orbilia brochopaga]|nr:hypothetical protein ABW21_db0207109 [Drechslerella brochopaga]
MSAMQNAGSSDVRRSRRVAENAAKNTTSSTTDDVQHTAATSSSTIEQTAQEEPSRKRQKAAQSQSPEITSPSHSQRSADAASQLAPPALDDPYEGLEMDNHPTSGYPIEYVTLDKIWPGCQEHESQKGKLFRRLRMAPVATVAREPIPPPKGPPVEGLTGPFVPEGSATRPDPRPGWEALQFWLDEGKIDPDQRVNAEAYLDACWNNGEHAMFWQDGRPVWPGPDLDFSRRFWEPPGPEIEFELSETAWFPGEHSDRTIYRNFNKLWGEAPAWYLDILLPKEVGSANGTVSVYPRALLDCQIWKYDWSAPIGPWYPEVVVVKPAHMNHLHRLSGRLMRLHHLFATDKYWGLTVSTEKGGIVRDLPA